MKGIIFVGRRYGKAPGVGACYGKGEFEI